MNRFLHKSKAPILWVEYIEPVFCEYEYDTDNFVSEEKKSCRQICGCARYHFF